MLFYDERHQHRLGNTVGNGSRMQIPTILQAADEILAGISIEERDFDQARADVIAAIQLNGTDVNQG